MSISASAVGDADEREGFSVAFEVRVIPRGQGRPRATKRGAFAGIHKDEKSRRWEATFAAIAHEHHPGRLLEGPVAIVIGAVFPRPKRLQRKKDPAGLVAHAQKPDTDNIAKAVLDGLASWWTDDCQVQDLRCRKWFAEKAGYPRLHITVREIR